MCSKMCSKRFWLRKRPQMEQKLLLRGWNRKQNFRRKLGSLLLVQVIFPSSYSMVNTNGNEKQNLISGNLFLISRYKVRHLGIYYIYL